MVLGVSVSPELGQEAHFISILDWEISKGRRRMDPWLTGDTLFNCVCACMCACVYMSMFVCICVCAHCVHGEA